MKISTRHKNSNSLVVPTRLIPNGVKKDFDKQDDAESVFYSQTENAALACPPKLQRRQASGAPPIVPHMMLQRDKIVSASIPQTRTATLADGGLPIVSRVVLRTNLIHASIADGAWVSSEEKAHVETSQIATSKRFAKRLDVDARLLNTRC